METKSLDPQISIKEIAETAGVHRSTASKVLNNSSNIKINQATRKRILKAAQDLGFERNNRFVTPGGVRSFGFINVFHYSKNDNPFYSDTFDGIDVEARNEKINMYLINNMERMSLVHLLNQNDFMGVISVGIDRNMLAAFEFTKRPIVVIEAPHHIDSSVLYAVRTDSSKGTYNAAKYLLNVGHRRIYYLGFSDDPAGRENIASLERWDGVAKALREEKINLSERKILVRGINKGSEEASAIDMGYRGMCELLKRELQFPIACVCYSDLHAEGAYKAVFEKKLRIPEDVSIVGYDNVSRSQELKPALTTINVPRIELGREAVKVLLAVEAGVAEHETILPSHLVIRDSVLEITQQNQ
ncbi:MAG: hypothetical protein A2Y07_10645 [Planctomycetes bacterium GWF2_50_10]|nr:MAG: hypothetical protein A2Y07_10645 [Planctomycetes bacterium GWF2_50_10]